MRALPILTSVLAFSLAAVVPLGAQVSGYTWTFKGNPGGSGQVIGQTLLVTGANNGQTSLGHVSWMETTATAPAHVTVVCSYVNNDDGEYDAPCYVVDGIEHKADTGGYWGTGDYLFSFDVLAAHTFGFGIWTSDAAFGAGVGTFHDLLVTPATWADVGGSIDPRPYYDIDMKEGGLVSGFPIGLTGLGDIDGDGVRDLVVARTQPDGLRIVSGADGATLYTLPAPGSVGYGEALADAGDVNDDGVPDFILGADGSSLLAVKGGRIEVRSGLDGALLFAKDGTESFDLLGSSVVGLGDVNGDGFDDIAAGAGQLSGVADEGYVLVLGGPDGHLLYQLTGPTALGRFGAAVAALDDVDGDGIRDLAVAEPRVSPAHVYVYSGATGQYLSVASEPPLAFEAFLSGAGDFDGDGKGDYAWWQVAVSSTAITVKSGANGDTLAQWGATSVNSPEQGLACADFSGDGRPDVAFSIPDPVTLESLVRVYSGAPGHPLLHQFQAPWGGSYPGNFGLLLSAFGDADLDGAADLALGSIIPAFDEPLHVLRALDGKGVPRLLGTGTLSAGSPTTLAVLHGKPSSLFRLVIGISTLNAPFKGGILVPNPLLIITAATNNDGRCNLTAPWPGGVPGPFTFWSQAWFVDADGPQGFTASNGLSGTQP